MKANQKINRRAVSRPKRMRIKPRSSALDPLSARQPCPLFRSYRGYPSKVSCGWHCGTLLPFASVERATALKDRFANAMETNEIGRLVKLTDVSFSRYRRGGQFSGLGKFCAMLTRKSGPENRHVIAPTNRILDADPAAEFNATGIAVKALSANAFIEPVRAFHLNRMPKFHVDFTGSQCAYCGKVKDRRSMKIDHIIPMVVYCRLRMVRGNHSSRADCDRYYRDPTNLLLSCQKCNSQKSNKLPDKAVLTRRGGKKSAYQCMQEVAAAGSALHTKMVQNKARYAEISTLSPARKAFVLGGPGAQSTHSMGG